MTVARRRTVTTTHPDGTRIVVEEELVPDTEHTKAHDVIVHQEDQEEGGFGWFLTMFLVVGLGLLLLTLVGVIDINWVKQKFSSDKLPTSTTAVVEIDLKSVQTLSEGAKPSKVVFRETGEVLPELGPIFDGCSNGQGGRNASTTSEDGTEASSWGVHGSKNYFAEGREPENRWYGQDLKCSNSLVLAPMDGIVTATSDVNEPAYAKWGYGCKIHGVGIYKDYFMHIIHTNACQVEGLVRKGTPIATIGRHAHLHVVTEYKTFDVPYTMLTAGGDFPVVQNWTYNSTVEDEIILKYFVMPGS